MKEPIFLLGMRGAGKTSLGQEAARQLRVPFTDLDQSIEAKLGESTISFIEREGEAKFRELETEALQKYLVPDFGTAFVALGGGIVESALSRELIARIKGSKIYLQADAEILWARLKITPERLRVGDLADLNKFSALLGARKPHFEALADIVIPNNSDTLAGVKALVQEARQIWDL